MSVEDEIEIAGELQDPEELKHLIEQTPGKDLAPFNFRLRRLPTADRSVDASVLVALVSDGAGVLVALINAIVAPFEKKGVVKIQMKNGDEVEYPANMSSDQINSILQVHHKVGIRRIKVIGKARKP